MFLFAANIKLLVILYALKDYISSSKERLWGGAERRIFDLPANEKVELLGFYIKMFGKVFILDRRSLWDALPEDERQAILKKAK